MRAFVVVALLAVATTASAAPPEYVTVRDHLMCRTQAALRDALRALETKDKELMGSIGGCHFTVDGIPASLVQDNISRIRIHLSAEGEEADMWTVPEAIRRPRGRME